MRSPIAALGLVLAAAGAACAPVAPSPPTAERGAPPHPSDLPPARVAAEAALLRAALRAEVPELETLPPERERALLALAQQEVARSALALERTQLLVVVDRNPEVQRLALVLARPNGEWESLGAARVSTGMAGRRGYFITPTCVFRHSTAILDYRARGTFNAQGIRGLGVRGMRVWDFGWVPAQKGWREADAEPGEIRLLLHATDPDLLEPLLGRPASQGCVRVPAAVNRFLDRRGVLDVGHERAAAEGNARIGAVLRPDREPTPLAGDAMVVVDSSAAP
ncbi:MAG: L,D-transpeptidase [Acetobacteraceae bacterium]|nr:L,D-transpeptidase [Acetobacteraceae bacterium]